MKECDINKKVHQQRTVHLYSNLRSGLIGTALVTTLLTVFLVNGPLSMPSLGVNSVWAWCGITVFVLLFRLRLSVSYSKALEPQEDWQVWQRRFRFWAAWSGMCWGLLGAVSATASVETNYFVLLIITAMVVSAIPYLAADGRSYFYFLLGSVVPVTIAMFFSEAQLSSIIAMFTTIFGLGVWRSANSYSNVLTSSLKLQISEEFLIDELSAANEQLGADLDHRKEVARQLQQARKTAESANRAKTVFLSRMSHELRTPLNAVLGFSELLSIMPLEELIEKKDDYLRKIKSSGAHLLSLIEDILDITRIDDGKVRFIEQDVVIAEVVDECMTMLEPDIKASSLTIRVDTSSDMSLAIYSDRLRFRQIMLNLLTNAIKYNKNNGRVEVKFENHGESSVRIEVKDTGIGIADEDLEKAFMPFVRIAAESETIDGTGIGLTITKQLIELMGGSIGISSVVDQGTSVTVILPHALDNSSRIRATGS